MKQLSYRTISALAVVALGVAGFGGDQVQLPTTPTDFYQPGTQPLPEGFQEFEVTSHSCVTCHSFSSDDNPTEMTAPIDNWAMSMMAQSMRDPVFQAAVTISNQDAAGSGAFCFRCHAPAAYGTGRGLNGSFDELIAPDDFDGVNCGFCHRIVDGEFDADENPPQDEAIHQALIDAGHFPDPDDPGNGRFIFDPIDDRRGPISPGVNMHGSAQIVVSPHHSEASICASCHDLSNPVFSLQEDGTWALNSVDSAHPTQKMHEMFPEQRTYSEWLASEFADEGVAFPDGRFGGEGHPDGIMRSCQDCHMPKMHGANCAFWYDPAIGTHPDLDQHALKGGDTWVIGAVHDLHDPYDTNLTDWHVETAIDRTVSLLQAASDMEAVQMEDALTVRVTNWSGHKLPTGFPEGRRMWVQVKFLDAKGALLEEVGGYDYDTATLDSAGTTVFEMKLGMDEAVAAAANLEPGESFHLVLNNVIVKDNRIPPVGFTNAQFEAIMASPVAETYVDGQHWHDSLYQVPTGADQAVVTLLFQSSSREYMEFLRDANVTDNRGQIAYDAWVARGKSAPVAMDSIIIDLDPFELNGDINGDGVVDVIDLLALLAAFGPCEGCPADLDGDGQADVNDLLIILANWS
ncbi:MAG: dockerin type I repeat-containing protein [Phycisphaerales bacterium]|nr:dockerin type I repeat-containing protein [Phycisphaerales bacterium]